MCSAKADDHLRAVPCRKHLDPLDLLPTAFEIEAGGNQMERFTLDRSIELRTHTPLVFCGSYK